MFDDFKVANYPKSLVSPELYARPLAKLFSGDVIDGFTVTPGTGLKVILAPGNALIRYGSSAVASARIVSLVNDFELTIDTADVSNPRIDLVVVYVDNDVDLPDGTPSSANLDGTGVAKAKIVKGSAAANPSAPNATAIQSSVGAGNPYTVVREVRVEAGASVIAENKLKDVRALAGVRQLDLPSVLPTLKFGNYSLEEVDTGFTWFDGRPIYKKSFSVSARPQGTSTVPHGIENLHTVIDFHGAYTSTSGTRIAVPHVQSESGTAQWQIQVAISQTNLEYNRVAGAIAASHLTVWYTKA